jgi:hypothetical protein
MHFHLPNFVIPSCSDASYIPIRWVAKCVSETAIVVFFFFLRSKFFPLMRLECYLKIFYKQNFRDHVKWHVDPIS